MNYKCFTILFFSFFFLFWILLNSWKRHPRASNPPHTNFLKQLINTEFVSTRHNNFFLNRCSIPIHVLTLSHSHTYTYAHALTPTYWQTRCLCILFNYVSCVCVCGCVSLRMTLDVCMCVWWGLCIVPSAQCACAMCVDVSEYCVFVLIYLTKRISKLCSRIDIRRYILYNVDVKGHEYWMSFFQEKNW